MALTYKKRAFIEEYLIDFNGNQAAIRAGYSKRTARSQAHRLLTNADIQAAIEKRINELSMSADEVIIRLTNIARNGLKSSRLRSSDVMKALELIGKHKGLFKERMDITSGDRPIKGYMVVSPEDWPQNGDE